MNALPDQEPGRHHGAHPAHRGSICLEDGEIISQDAWPGEQFVLRIRAPRCAARALPASRSAILRIGAQYIRLRYGAHVSRTGVVKLKRMVRELHLA